MKKLILVFLPILILTVSSPAFPSRGEDAAACFLKGNEAYQQGDYEKARALYEKILALGIRNGEVYYNLGNTYFRLGQIGRAIQNYLSARTFTPRNEDLEANLKYARQEALDKIEPSPAGVFREIFFWYDRLNLRETTYAFLFCNLLFWTVLTLKLFRKTPFLNWLLALSALFSLTFAGTAATRIITLHLYRPAVIVSPTAGIRSGTDPKSDLLFILHDGAEVVVEKTRGPFALIRLPSGKRGWTRTDRIGMVCEEM